MSSLSRSLPELIRDGWIKNPTVCFGCGDDTKHRRGAFWHGYDGHDLILCFTCAERILPAMFADAVLDDLGDRCDHHLIPNVNRALEGFQRGFWRVAFYGLALRIKVQAKER